MYYGIHVDAHILASALHDWSGQIVFMYVCLLTCLFVCMWCVWTLKWNLHKLAGFNELAWFVCHSVKFNRCIGNGSIELLRCQCWRPQPQRIRANYKLLLYSISGHKKGREMHGKAKTMEKPRTKSVFSEASNAIKCACMCVCGRAFL